MSDMTSLSSNYTTTAEFAKDFNGAVLVLKRRHLAQQSPRPPAADEEAQVRNRLAEYVQGIVAQLATEAAEDVAAPAERIPDAITVRLAEKNQSKMAWLVRDLRDARRKLESGGSLSDEDFAVLDEVCDAADATASASFRRLWRR
jgi:hypothetical protein